jgi:DNA-binding response OmpR family regulator
VKFLLKTGFLLVERELARTFNWKKTMFSLFKTKNKTATILVVDDEPDLVLTIKNRLEWNKYKVETAADGAEGLEKAESVRPDLILLDCNMPVMSGLDMLELLRKNKKLKKIPVMMLTAVSETYDIDTASILGVAGYVTKPFNFTELLDKISDILDKR